VTEPSRGSASLATRVARVTLFFWIIKICATTIGETAGDLLSMTLDVGYAASSMILVGAFFVSLVAQLRSRRFHPLLFWTVILTTSTAGTTMSDFMDRTLGLGYAKGSLLLAACVAVMLALWRWSVGTLSVQDVRSRRAEMFYWFTILVSNTLGTALGDYLADDSGLGFGGSAALIGGLLLVVVALMRWTRVSRVALFWVAFVLTRPFGATFGDLLSKPVRQGGLGIGTVGSTVVLFGLLLGFLAWDARRARAVQAPA